MANPVTRKDMFLNAIALGDPELLPIPVTREERFLRALSTGEEITPTTFEERFLQAAIAFKGSVEPPPSTDPLMRTREDFAIMANYPTYTTKSTQASADSFIDTLHADKNVFAVIAISRATLWVFATTGTYIDFNAGIISSDGDLYRATNGSPNTGPTGSVDWSAFPDAGIFERFTRA